MNNSNRLNFELAKQKEAFAVANESMIQRMQSFERAIAERDRSHEAVIDTYEARLLKHKTELDRERAEKLVILRDFNTLKEKYFQEL